MNNIDFIRQGFHLMKADLYTIGYVVATIGSVAIFWKIFSKNSDRLPVKGNVVVTGASRGLGYICAIDLANAGYRVFSCVRKDEDFARFRDALSKEAKGAIIPITMSVDSDESVSKAVAKITEEIEKSSEKGLHGLINNAGMFVGGPIENVSMTDWNNIVQTNILGTIRVTQAFMPLIEKGKGRILNVGSPAGRVVIPMWTPYCLTKAAINVLSDSLRIELKSLGIPVIVLDPAVLKTDMVDNALNTQPEESKKKWPKYAKVIDANRKFVLATHGPKNQGNPSLFSGIALAALTDRKPRRTYMCGDTPPAFVSILPVSVVEWIWTTIFGA